MLLHQEQKHLQMIQVHKINKGQADANMGNPMKESAFSFLYRSLLRLSG